MATRQYSNNYRGHDTSELDPCIAAESRMKKSVVSSKMKRVFVLLAVLLTLFVVVGLLVILLANRADVDYDVHEPAAEDSMQDLSQNGIYGKQAEEDTSTTARPTEATRPPKTTKRPVTVPRHPVPVPVEPIYTPSSKATTTTSTTTTTTTMAPTTTTTSRPTTASTTPSTTTTTTTIRTVPPTTPAKPYSRPILKPTLSPPAGYYQAILSPEPVTDNVRKDCLEHLYYGLGSGVYRISPRGNSVFNVYCDMTTDGGGWTVVQRRGDNAVFHTRTYSEYQSGFGDLEGSYWLGLEAMHRLTAAEDGDVTMRIELRGDTCQDCSHQPNGSWWGEWNFALGDAASDYRLSVSPTQLRGNLSNPQNGIGMWESMSDGQSFTTIDRDNDESDFNCAQFRNLGGWWHKDCTHLALNGLYGDTRNKLRYLVYHYFAPYAPGVQSPEYHLHPKETLMMIRRQM